MSSESARPVPPLACVMLMEPSPLVCLQHGGREGGGIWGLLPGELVLESPSPGFNPVWAACVWLPVEGGPVRNFVCPLWWITWDPSAAASQEALYSSALGLRSLGLDFCPWNSWEPAACFQTFVWNQILLLLQASAPSLFPGSDGPWSQGCFCPGLFLQQTVLLHCRVRCCCERKSHPDWLCFR